MQLSKRTILWIIPLMILGALFYVYGPEEEITDNTYIDYIKTVSLDENSNTTIEQALENYCTESKWVYFETQDGQPVVEFKGECPVNGTSEPVNLQFTVDEDLKNYKVGVLLIDHEQQEEAQRNAFIETVYQTL